jgi:hypothetical protein
MKNSNSTTSNEALAEKLGEEFVSVLEDRAQAGVMSWPNTQGGTYEIQETPLAGGTIPRDQSVIDRRVNVLDENGKAVSQIIKMSGTIWTVDLVRPSNDVYDIPAADVDNETAQAFIDQARLAA